MVDAAGLVPEAGERLGERPHPEITARIRRIGAVQAIEEGGDLQHLRAVLDEVLVDQFFSGQRARRGWWRS